MAAALSQSEYLAGDDIVGERVETSLLEVVPKTKAFASVPVPVIQYRDNAAYWFHPQGTPTSKLCHSFHVKLQD